VWAAATKHKGAWLWYFRGTLNPISPIQHHDKPGLGARGWARPDGAQPAGAILRCPGPLSPGDLQWAGLPSLGGSPAGPQHLAGPACSNFEVEGAAAGWQTGSGPRIWAEQHTWPDLTCPAALEYCLPAGPGHGLGPYWPEWTGPEEPGAPSPFAWLDAGTLIEENNKQPTGYPMYWSLPTDRPNLRLGSRKGAYCPKWEV
jgi:hypothetical protein